MAPWQPILALILALVAFTGCAPQIGDDCTSSVDCSVNGDRVCDLSQPGGYCTVANCEEGTCPEEPVCVEFRFEPARSAESWCMAPCESDGDCRESDGYACIRASELLEADMPLARVLDGDGDDGRRFCGLVR